MPYSISINKKCQKTQKILDAHVNLDGNLCNKKCKFASTETGETKLYDTTARNLASHRSDLLWDVEGKSTGPVQRDTFASIKISKII